MTEKTEANKCYIQRPDGTDIYLSPQFGMEIWNLAIEAAANVIDECNREGPYNAIGGARRIRELKK